MLVACVLPTAILQLKKRIKHKILQKAVVCFLAVFTVFMIAARVISGVHWLSDVIGGVLISTALVFYYRVLNALI